MSIVMIVEDDARIADLFKRAFEKEGFGVILKASAEEAMLPLNKGWRPQLIVIDQSLPGGNATGLDLLKTIKSKSSTADIPVILYDPTLNSDTAKRALELGANHIMRRPVNPKDLVTAAKELLSQSE